ncbi:MAG: bifunctional aspartate transaminase/aspartate 4-decarboxylase [Ilumatobacteraceae bacterium]
MPDPDGAARDDEPLGSTPAEIPVTFELQSAIAAAARESEQPLLDAGRGQPNWLATVPRAGHFRLGAFAVEEAVAASSSLLWGQSPPQDGIAERLAAALAGDSSMGAQFLSLAVAYGIDELGFEPDPWVHELTKAVLGAGYPSPTRMLTHLERVVERYITTVTDSPPAAAGRIHVFGTEGGAAAMAYVFRTLQENHIVAPGDKLAITTPIFTPYLQIPVLEDFGFEVAELRSAHNAPYRFGDEFLEQLLDPAIKVFFLVNPGNPDSRAIRPEKLVELRDLVLEKRPDLVIVADTVYATFVDGFRSTFAELPRNVILLHSFSKNFGATGSRLGFIALSADNVLDELLAAQGPEMQRIQSERYRSITSDVSQLPFISRLVADSREVALHNIAGLATPDQVQMGFFALAYLLPDGKPYVEGTRSELGRRLDALLGPLGIRSPGGQDSMYYALIDLLQVATVRHGGEFAMWLTTDVRPEEVPLRLARERGVVVLPGQIFDSESWDVRVSLASLTADELGIVGEAIVSVLDELAAERAAS